MAKRDYYEVLGVAKGASADEIKKAAENLRILADESMPYEKQGNGAIEVFVKLFKWGNRASILQAGTGSKTWAKAGEH